MQRSGWKLPYISSLFLSKMFFKSTKFYTMKRNITITKHFDNKKLSVYSGHQWKTIRVRKLMVGYKLGDFSMSKIFGSAIAESMSIKQQRKKEDKKKKKK